MHPWKARILWLFPILFCSGVSCEQICPPDSLVTPCYCNEYERTVTCSDVERPQDIDDVFQRIPNWVMSTLILENLVMESLPKSVLDRAHFETLNISNSYFQRLFDGLPSQNKHISRLHFSNVRVIQGFEWEMLSGVELGEFSITDSSIPAFDDNFRKNINANEMTGLWLEKTRTHNISNRAFSNFVMLRVFSLRRSFIKSIARDMFPKPWNSLISMDLSFNQLKTLPKNIFDEMPYLQMVYLQKNIISTISEEVFKNKPNKISRIYYFDGNPINCDCNIKWLLEVKSIGVTGNCVEPKEWKGRQLLVLKNKDFSYCG